MNPHIENVSENGNILSFTLSGVNVSMANAIRRTILSDVPLVIFKTAPYESSKANIMVNTSRLNNEILKQRLSCIPIHIASIDMLKDHIMEVDMTNDTDTIMYVTSGDFKIKNQTTGEYIKERELRDIFPPCEIGGYFIDFARLRPKISDDLPGEKLSLTCEFSVGTAKDDNMFNAVSTCAYGYTLDKIKIEEELGKHMQVWKDKGLDKSAIEFEVKNWRLLDGMRIAKRDSFDFTIETIGVYPNRELVQKACAILIDKLNNLSTLIDTDELDIIPSENTLPNSFDIILKDEDYTIGKMMEYVIYSKFFEELKILSYCGFKKMHPHDNDSIIRVAYHDVADVALVKQNIKICIVDAIVVYEYIMKKM